jgi:hypothetical protein
VETNFPVAQQFVASLRSQKKEDDRKGGATKGDRRYMSSQYFADSSLSQDVSQSSFFGGSSDNEDSQQGNEEAINVPDRAQAKTVETESSANSEGTSVGLRCLSVFFM